MKVCLVLLVLWPMATVFASEPVGVWQPPEAVPSQCAEFGAEVLLLNVSRSMLRAGEFARAQESAAQYVVRNAPECTLLIVGSFGVTADVASGEFIVDQRSRVRLSAAVLGLRANQAYTSRDEAAKLIELLSYQLCAAYGTPANKLIVRVYTDEESRGNPDAPQWTVAEYLACRMKARYVRLYVEDYADGRHLQIRLTGGATATPKESARSQRSPAVGERSALLLALILLVIVVGFSVRKHASRRMESALFRLGVSPGEFEIDRRRGHGVRSDR